MKTPRVIVSLTSFPGAIDLAHIAIRSVLEGSVVPDKVVLYLAAPQFPDRRIPDAVEALKHNPRFEVRWVERDIRSYKKLVPALSDFPDDVIITIDDDVRYNRNMVKRLLGRHKKYPHAVIGHRVRRIEFAPDGEPMSYVLWRVYRGFRHIFRSEKPSFRNIMTGVGGVLYPPHSLDMDMLDADVFMTLAPTVDDVWFWAAAVAAGTGIAPVPFGLSKIHDTGKPVELTLMQVNINSGVDVNRDTLLTVLEKYPIISQRLKG